MMIESKKMRRSYSQKRRKFNQIIQRIEANIFDEVKEGRIRVLAKLKVFYYLI